MRRDCNKKNVTEIADSFLQLCWNRNVDTEEALIAIETAAAALVHICTEDYSSAVETIDTLAFNIKNDVDAIRKQKAQDG